MLLHSRRRKKAKSEHIEPVSKNESRKYKVLEARLLELGGERVDREPEVFLDDVLKQGRVFTGRPRRVPGVQGEPHRSTAVECLATRGRFQVVVGFALRDGTWARHAWLWDGRQVIETTSPAQVYYGALLDKRGAAYFVFREVCGMLPGAADRE